MKGKWIQKVMALSLAVSVSLGSFAIADAGVRSDRSKLKVPKGNLIADVWRGQGKRSGNTIKWNYQVSSKYKGKKKVKWIQTKWYSSASLRKSATISLGLSKSKVRASKSSSWKRVTTTARYWKNSNGSKSADWRSNTVVGPSKDYRTRSIFTCNTGTVRLKGYPKKYEISASI